MWFKELAEQIMYLGRAFFNWQWISLQMVPTKFTMENLILNRRCVCSGYRNGIDDLVSLGPSLQ